MRNVYVCDDKVSHHFSFSSLTLLRKGLSEVFPKKKGKKLNPQILDPLKNLKSNTSKRTLHLLQRSYREKIYIYIYWTGKYRISFDGKTNRQIFTKALNGKKTSQWKENFRVKDRETGGGPGREGG